MSNGMTETQRAIVTSVIVAGFVVAQVVVGQALRDGFFLSHFDSTLLPAMPAPRAKLSPPFLSQPVNTSCLLAAG